MKKLYLIPVFLFIAGILSEWMPMAQAAPNNDRDGVLTTFPSCSIGVSASIAGSGTGGGTSPVCPGTPVSLASSITGGTAPFTYSWTPGAGLSNASIANPVATVSVTTTYTLSVTDNAGCTGSASVTIAVAAPPVIQPDSVLEEYLTGRALTAMGGVPPYAYVFSPSINTNSLLSLPNTNTTFTIIVTGANGCSSTEYANYVPVTSIEACSSLYMSEYIQDTVMGSLGGMNDAIELYNPTSHSINLNNYYLTGTTNGSLLSPPFIIPLSGTISSHSTFLIANSNANISLTSRANMLSGNLNFNGKDVVSLENVCINQPNVTCTFLDEIGAISPRPTANGWAVGFGSTKNHTLQRRSAVTVGTLNWAVSRYEWTSYPQGTLSKIGLYRGAVCSAGTPDLTLSFANATSTCTGSDHYFEFDVIVSSDQPTWFDNCVMWLLYNTSAFGTYVATNGNVTVTAYPNFSGPTYQVQAGDIDFDTLSIPLGIDPSQASWSRTQITSTPQPMVHVKMKVQGCGYLADISFTDTAINQIQDLSWYTLNQNDSEVYSIPYNYTYYTGSLNNTLCQMTITHYTNPIAAGTNAKSIPANSSIMTVTGTGFGNDKGIVHVSDANESGIVSLDTLDILSWSNTEIKIKMPSYLYNNPNATPGSGPFIVENTCGDSITESLQINYNIEDAHTNTEEKLRTDIVMGNDTESILFRCDTSISNNTAAYACVKKAIREWNCYTGVNWKVGPPIILDTNLHDNISVIYFGNNGYFLPSGAVMVTNPWSQSCGDYTDSIAFTKESDTKIKRNQYLSGSLTWSYDTTNSILPSNVLSFYDVITHEIGHAHGLGHINDTSSLMYWLTRVGGHPRVGITTGSAYPGPASLLGGLDMVNTSAAYSNSCSYIQLVPDSRTCTDPNLGVNNTTINVYGLNLYPNPTDGSIIAVSYELSTYSQVEFKITDCLGRIITNFNAENRPPGNYTAPINVAPLAQGVYFFVATINGERQTIKFIKL